MALRKEERDIDELVEDEHAQEVVSLRQATGVVHKSTRQVRVRKPNWSEMESNHLLQEYIKYKNTLNGKATCINAKKKRRHAWARISASLNAKGWAVRRTVYECKRRWKNMVTFAKLDIMDYIKARKLGITPRKEVTDSNKQITKLHGDTDLLKTLASLEDEELGGEKIGHSINNIPREVNTDISEPPPPGNITVANNHHDNIDQNMMNEVENYTAQNGYIEAVMESQCYDSDQIYPINHYHEQTPSIGEYFSVHAHQNRSVPVPISIAAINRPHAPIYSSTQESAVPDIKHSPISRIANKLREENEESLKKRKLKLELDKLKLEKEVLEMQKVKLKIETKVWRKMLNQQQPQATPLPFYWPAAPPPGYAPFYPGPVAAPQIPVVQPTLNQHCKERP